MYLLRLVFFGDMSVKSDGKLNSRAAYDLLLSLIFKKLGYVVVCFKAVQAVIIDVDFPKNALFRHTTEKPMRILASRLYKGEKIGVRDTRRATATFGEGKNISVCDRVGMSEVFDQTKIEEGHVGACRQRVAVTAEQRA